MHRSNRIAILGLGSVICGLAVLGSACFVSLDESLIDAGDGRTDAGVDVDASINPDAGDAKSETDSTVSEAGPDAPDEARFDADQEIGPNPDAPDDVIDAADAGDGAVGEAGDGGNFIDGPLAECYDQTWCPPVQCDLRSCDHGSCMHVGTMKEDTATFQLPAALACDQSENRACAVAVRNYLVALTNAGFVVFNTRNPYSVREQVVPNNIGPDYVHLVRSGERVWAIKNSVGGSTQLAWLDVPLDGVSALSPPTQAMVTVPDLSARHAAPNDAIYLYHVDKTPPGFVARYTPGMPTWLQSYPTNGANETTAIASTGSRLLLHERFQHSISPVTYRHQFSLQSDLLSATSANSGTYTETGLTNRSQTNGYFSVSRTGAVAWVIGRSDTRWQDVWAYWLVPDANGAVEPSSLVLETFTTVQPPGVPHGPLAFINNDTIAAAVTSGGASPAPMLDIVRRSTGTPPKLIKRIPTSPLAPGALTVAGAAGYAYLIVGTTVRMFAPSCKP